VSDFEQTQAGAEATDDDKLEGEFPPERPLGVEEYGTTAAEQRYEEPLEERVAREEPDRPSGGDPRDDGDRFAGEPATEREAPRAAEEDALHLAEPPPYREDDSYLDDSPSTDEPTGPPPAGRPGDAG
jgi:hypothetical protein